VNVRLYMDVHIPFAITAQLRLRKIDILTAQEDGTQRLEDSDLLNRSTELQRVLVSQDIDLLQIAGLRNKSGDNFSGLIYAHQLSSTIGQMVHDLELIVGTTTLEEWLNRVEYLPF
jgi:hypothetical protein